MIKPRVWLEIDLEAIAFNFRQVKQHVSPLKVMAVLKANAYGLGVERISETLVKSGVDAIGVAELTEALAVKSLGVPTYILGAILPEEMEVAIQHDIVVPVTDVQTAKLLSKTAERLGKKAKVSVLLDTGMGRLGIDADFTVEINKITAQDHLEFMGVYSHFPVAYSDQGFSNSQIDTFKEVISGLTCPNLDFHIANSDGINNVSASISAPFTMVRTGINLYGVHDLCGENLFNLKETITLKSRLVSSRLLKAGSSVGYGRSCVLKKDTQVGTVAAGYADGVPLAASNRGVVMVNGNPCPIIGKVSMDYITIDLSDAKNHEVGSNVILLGDGITVKDWAILADTIPYQVICSFGNRVKRVYI